MIVSNGCSSLPTTSEVWNGKFGSGSELEAVGGKEVDPMIISLIQVRGGYVQTRSNQQGGGGGGSC